jgi:hypothetical protein
MKFVGELASNVIDSENCQFTEEALWSFVHAGQTQELPVTINFDRTRKVGKILSAYLEGGEERISVMVEVELTEALPVPFYIVPGFQIEGDFIPGKSGKSKELRVFDAIEPTECAITNSPADISLKPLTEIK